MLLLISRNSPAGHNRTTLPLLGKFEVIFFFILLSSLCNQLIERNRIFWEDSVQLEICLWCVDTRLGFLYAAKREETRIAF